MQDWPRPALLSADQGNDTVLISPRKRSALPERPHPYSHAVARSESMRAGDRVTISPEARELHAAAEREADFMPNTDSADLDVVHAVETARAYAYSLDREKIDRTDEIAGTGPARYAATGDPVTRESERHFNVQAREIRTRRIALYEAELTAGTAPELLIAHLVAFMQAQPLEYRAILDWDRLRSHARERGRSDFAAIED